MTDHDSNRAWLAPAVPSTATLAAQCKGAAPPEIYDIRRANLLLLIAERTNGSKNAFAKLLGYRRSNIHSFLSTTYNNGRSIGDLAARRIERKANVACGRLDLPIEAKSSAATEISTSQCGAPATAPDLTAQERQLISVFRSMHARSQATFIAMGGVIARGSPAASAHPSTNAGITARGGADGKTHMGYRKGGDGKS